MSQVSKDASEKAFQENFVKELKKNKWHAPDYLDGNKHKVTVGVKNLIVLMLISLKVLR